jgi:hypothetical protein
MAPNATPGKDCIVVDASTESATGRQALGTIRAFRDKVLAASEFGRQLVGEFNLFTPRVLFLFVVEPSLRKEAGRFIDAVTPIIDTMLPRRSSAADPPKCTQKTINSVTRFTNALIAADIKHKHDSNLSAVVRARLVEIKAVKLIGLRGDELRRALGLEA